MKIELNNKEKQLKLNEQEIQTVRKEAREQLRLVYRVNFPGMCR